MASKASSKKASGKTSKQGQARRRPSSAYAVFISHSSKESWIARQMAKEVKALGAVPWVDVNDLQAGDDFQMRILEAIRNCTEAIILVSPNSVSSQWVSFEIGAVVVQGKRATPVLNNVAPEEMATLSRVNAIDLNDFDDYLRQLKERVRQHRRGGRR